MDINYSSLMAQLAAQKKGSEEVWSQNDPGQKLSRMMRDWINAMGDKAASQPRSRVAANAQPQESMEDRVDKEMAAATERGKFTRSDSKTPSMLAKEAEAAKAEQDREATEAKYAQSQQRNPVANYLAGVTDQNDYRPAMMQYLSAGGKKPAWYTGNYETDKVNIDSAIEASMTPMQQLTRKSQQENLESLQENREAQLELRKQAQADKVREQVAKREAIKPKPSEVIPTKNERVMADEALEGLLGSETYTQLPPEQAADVARTVAARAKAKMNTPEGKGVDYESLVQDELQELMAKGELKKGKDGGWFGIGSEKPSFTRAEKPSAGKVPQPGQVYKGYKYKGGDPSKPTSWEKS